MILTDDIVLVGENLEKVNNRLDEWKLTFKGKGLRICRNKTEYTKYDFGGRYQRVKGMRKSMTISNVEIDEFENFKYLG